MMSKLMMMAAAVVAGVMNAPTAGAVELVGSGRSDYVIACNTNDPAVVDLQKYVERMTAVRLPLVDALSNAIPEKAIVITSDANKLPFKPGEISTQGYRIRVVGPKVFIYSPGDSPDALKPQKQRKGRPRGLQFGVYGLLDEFFGCRFLTSAAKCPALNVFKAAQVFFRDQSLFSVTAVANLIDNGDVHHIFPKEFLKSNGLRFTQYNQVANFTYLETPINIAIGKKSPAEYFSAAFRQCETKKPEIGSMIDIDALKQTMEMNCVPEDVVTMSVEDYESKFLTKRRELMAAKIRKYYEAL